MQFEHITLRDVTFGDVKRAKHAIGVLSDVTRVAVDGKPMSPELSEEVKALIRIIRTVEWRMMTGRGM